MTVEMDWEKCMQAALAKGKQPDNDRLNIMTREIKSVRWH